MRLASLNLDAELALIRRLVAVVLTDGWAFVGIAAQVAARRPYPAWSASSCLGRQEAGEWMRRLDNADCHIDCFLRFLVCQQLAGMSCGVTWVDEVIA